MCKDNIEIRDAIVYWKTKYKDEIQSLFERKDSEELPVVPPSSMRI